MDLLYFEIEKSTTKFLVDDDMGLLGRQLMSIALPGSEIEFLNISTQIPFPPFFF